MAHQRKLIRQAVVAALSGATSAGTRVSATKVEPHRKAQLPAISVYTLRDIVDPDKSNGTAPRELTRSAQVEVTAWVGHTDEYPVDDRMDDIAEQIEAAMDLDPYLDGAAGDSVLEETVMQVVEDDGRSDPLVGIVTLTYSVEYRTTQGETVVDDFLRVDAKTPLVGGVADTAIPEDLFTVQETTP